MSIEGLALVFTALIVITCTVAAQDQPQDQNQKVIQHATIQSTSPRVGQGNVHDLLCRLPRLRVPRGTGGTKKLLAGFVIPSETRDLQFAAKCKSLV